MRKTFMLIGLLAGFCLVTAKAQPDFYRLYLPNNTSEKNLQRFYCIATPNKTKNPRIIMSNRAQMITGFKNADSNAHGQLIIYADELNQVYFQAYQDPDEPNIQGYVQAIGTGEVDIVCKLGDGNGERILMPGDYGVTR